MAAKIFCWEAPDKTWKQIYLQQKHNQNQKLKIEFGELKQQKTRVDALSDNQKLIYMFAAVTVTLASMILFVSRPDFT